MKSFVRKLLQNISYYCEYPSYYIELLLSKRFSYRALRGLERNSGLPLNLLYLGEGYSLDYFKTIFFQSVTHESEITQYSLLDLFRGISPMPKEYDLRICEFTPRTMNFIPKKGRFKIPEWIEQEIPLEGSWEDVVGRFRKNTKTTDLRLVRKYKYTSDVVNDPESLKYFYNVLYLPYVKHRFQKAVQIVDDEWLIAVAEKGGLLRILNGDQVIAGAVLHRGKQYLDWLWIGALMQNGQDLYKGASSSLYYHSIKYAHDEGFPKIKLNQSRPFLSDGVYRYKRKWGAHIVKGRYNDTCSFMDFNYDSKVCRQWLEASVIITEDRNGLYANLFVFDEMVKDELLIKNIENIFSPGLKGINIYSSSPVNDLPASIGSCQIRNRDLKNRLYVDND